MKRQTLLCSLQKPSIPVLAALLVTVASCLSWLRNPLSQSAESGPAKIPAVGYPVMRGRGATLLSSALSLTGVEIGELIVCDNSGGAPDVQCALEALASYIDGGSSEQVLDQRLRVQSLTVLRPQPRPGSPMLGVSECWNALADAAFEPPREALNGDAPGDMQVSAGSGQHPWLLLLNDDVGFPPGVLEAAARETWSLHLTHSLLLSTSALPGEGNSFSAFALTRAGFGALGRFDENFWPAYYEDCDYLQRAVRSPLPWRRSRTWPIVHPVEPADSDARLNACMSRLSPRARFNATRELDSFREMLGNTRLRVQDNPNRDAPNGNSAYFRRKWGRECDEVHPPAGRLSSGASRWFASPFNDREYSLAQWRFDATRRDNIFAGIE